MQGPGPVGRPVCRPGRQLIAYYLTHPQVAIDPDTSVPDWSLSTQGRARLLAALHRPWLRTLRCIVTSEERKAIETAELVGKAIGVAVEVRPGMGENDRSATGFITPDRFEAAADAFFAEPEVSWKGWETAVDAQRRIVAAVSKALNEVDADSPVLFVGHGAVGTLLKCHIAGRAIARHEDQPAGGGNLYAFEFGSRKLLCDWTAIEEFDGAQNG